MTTNVKRGVKLKTGRVRLMNRTDQMFIIEAPKYMITDIVHVYEDIQGVQMGRVKPTNEVVTFDKVSRVWRKAS